jgi:beta-glucosidase-like glycosyl hydrolase/4-amino-4-deoxy-L-arabinose transferase-like glycosyltransferase
MMGSVIKRIGFIPLLIIVLVLVTHGVNSWHYPYFENDEGTYTSQAWWLAGFHQLGPYTYWYDHAPFGWLQIGIWQLITGGPFTFGFSVYSTRTLMVLVAVATTLLLYYLVKELTKKPWVAFLAVSLFIFSPLAIYFHRRVLLDNLETLWFVSSFLVLVKAKSKLWLTAVSGALFGWAFLSKESTIFLLPGMLYGVWVFSQKENRRFCLLIWSITAFFIMGGYPLLALVRNELLPAGWFGNQTPHVSLIEGLLIQQQQRSGLLLSSFLQNLFASWWFKDPKLVLLSVWVLLVAAWQSLSDVKIRPVLIMAVSYLGYLLILVEGILILDFYVIPLLAIVAILFGLCLDNLGKRLTIYQRIGTPSGVAAGILLGLLLLTGQISRLYLANETGAQVAALQYVKKNLKPSDRIVVDDVGLLDLRLPTSDGPAFPNADWFAKIEYDPTVQKQAVQGKWQNIDYLLLTHEMVNSMRLSRLSLIQKAYENTELLADFPPGPGTYRNLDQFISTNGDWAQVLKVTVPPGQREMAGFGRIIQPNSSDQNLLRLISAMTLSQKAGQLLWISISGTKPTELTDQTLQTINPGGVILLGSNILDEKSLISLVGDLDSVEGAGTLRRPIVVTDQEGGTVSRIPFETQIRYAQADIKTPEQAKNIALLRGQQLRRWGIGVNLAPVADVSWLDYSTIARVQRGFPGDEQQVGDLVAASIAGYQEAGILPVVKHFPGGFGRTGLDSHVSLPVIGATEVEVEKDLVPFQKAISIGIGGVMVGHLSYPNIDPEYPTSMSVKFITDILRTKLGFGGVVIDDDISMEALSANYSEDQILEKAINAGVDVFIKTGSATEQQQTRDTIVRLVEEGKISEDRLDESVFRILKFKRGFLG